MRESNDKIFNFFLQLYNKRSVLWLLSSQQLILRYRRTVLGYIWAMINPLVMMSIMAAVFSTLYKVDLKTFAIFLFAGMIPWNLFSAIVNQSGPALINNEGLIKKVYLPKAIFPLSIAIALLVDGVLSFAALLAIMMVIGAPISWAILFLPLSFLLLWIFAVGLGLMFAIATVFFRDLQHITSFAMQGLFFLTPVLYKQDAISGRLNYLIELNPVTPFISLFRIPIVTGELPGFLLIGEALLISIATLLIGVYLFVREENKIVFRL